MCEPPTFDHLHRPYQLFCPTILPWAVVFKIRWIEMSIVDPMLMFQSSSMTGCSFTLPNAEWVEVIYNLHELELGSKDPEPSFFMTIKRSPPWFFRFGFCT